MPANLAPPSTVSFYFSVNPASSPAGTYTLFFQTLAPTKLTCGPDPCPTLVPTGQGTAQVILINLLYRVSTTPVRCAGQPQGSLSLSFDVPPPPGTTWQGSGPGGFTAGATPVLNNLFAGTYILTFSVPFCPPLSTSIALSEPPELNITGTVTQEIRCNRSQNGETTILDSGGTPPYQYSLNGGPWQSNSSFTGLPAGTYTIRVRDAKGCIRFRTYTLQQPPLLVLNAPTVTSVSCNGGSDGSITVSASGGTPPYQYSWVGLPQFGGSATISGVLPGVYEGVVVDANGCRDTVEVEIPYRSYVDAGLRPTDVAGCVPLAVSWVALPSGVGPYRYEWDLGDGTMATDSAEGNLAF